MEDVINLSELEGAMEVYVLYKSMLVTAKSKKRPVFEKWKNNFGIFYKWAKENGFNYGLRLKRKSTHYGYVPENLTFIDPKKLNNRAISRDKIFLKHGNDVKSVTDWSYILGVPRTTLYDRIQRGWTDEEVIEGRRKAR